MLTTPNVGFVISRLAHLLGHFTDFTDMQFPTLHVRFWTYNSLERLLDLTGFEVVSREGCLKSLEYRFRVISPLLRLLARVRPQLFSIGIIVVARAVSQPQRTRLEWVIPEGGTMDRLTTFWRQS